MQETEVNETEKIHKMHKNFNISEFDNNITLCNDELSSTYSSGYPSQFACQTGEVKKFNPMMDVIIA